MPSSGYMPVMTRQCIGLGGGWWRRCLSSSTTAPGYGGSSAMQYGRIGTSSSTSSTNSSRGQHWIEERQFSSSTSSSSRSKRDEARGGGGGGGGGDDGSDSTKDTSKGDLVIDEEEFNAITDKIPQRPMSVVEGTSYTLVIIAALGFAAAVLYAAFSELLFSPKEYTCYSKALARIEDDPRVTIRLGSPIHAYGTESRNRSARQRIPHRIYNDANGVEHVQLQFHAKGPSGKAVVHADMYKEGQEYKYHFLYLTVESPLPQQVVLIRPHQPDNE